MISPLQSYDDKPATRTLAALPIRIPPRAPAMAAAVICWVIGIAIGVYVTMLGSRATGELSLDKTVAADRGSIVVDVSKVINVVLGPTVGPVVLLVLCVVLWRTLGRNVAIWTAFLTLVGWMSIEVFKIIFHRGRPPTAVVHALVTETKPDSFPSGHTAFTTALVLGLFIALCGHATLRRWVLILGIPLVIVVAASRLILGAHYLGDVTAAPFLAAGTILALAAFTTTGGRWGRPSD